MPPNEQPRYWTDYLALEQERYNQRLQWEQQMANQLNTLCDDPEFFPPLEGKS